MERSWNGAIPCLVSLAPSDVTTSTPPPPLLLSLRRRSYFVVELGTAISSFESNVAIDGEEEIKWWVVDKRSGRPLRSLLPVGCNFDVFFSPRLETPINTPLSTASSCLPWELELTTSAMDAVPLELEATKTNYFHALKSSLVGLRGTPSSFFALPTADQNAMWDGMIGRASEGSKDYWERVGGLLGKGMGGVIKVLVVGGSRVEIPMHSCVAKEGKDSLRKVVESAVGRELPPEEGFVVQGVHIHGEDIDVASAWKDLRHPDGALYVTVKLGEAKS